MKLNSFCKKLIMLFGVICALTSISFAECAHLYEWAKNDTMHYKSCGKCGDIMLMGTHEFEEVDTDKYHYEACKVCGEIRNQVAHSFSTKYDGTYHYEECGNCGYVKNKEKHIFKSATSETYHYEACECGKIRNKEAHTFKSAISETHHYEACECGKIRNKEAHIFKSATSETHHYEACECGKIRNKEAHTFKSAISETHHYEACECGKIRNSEAHNFETAKNETHHYEACKVCGKIRNQGNHTYGAWMHDTTNHWKVCSVCSIKVNTAAHTYSGNKCTVCGYVKDCTHKSGAWEKNSTNHWKTCTLCGVYTVNETAHKFVNGKCECGYACTHTLGNWQHDTTNHWKVCSVCKLKVNAAAHTYSGNKCTVCEYVKDCTHKLGSWEVKDGIYHVQKCTICGVTVNTAKHNMTKYTQKDATTHYVECVDCGYRTTESHTDAKPCTKCGYEKVCSHTPSAWHKDGTNHWKTCTICGAYTTAKEAHKFDGNKCTVCEYEKACTHTPGDWKYNSTKHWKLCTICSDYIVERTDHTFKNDKCTVCGYERDSEDNDTDISVSPRSGSYVSYGDRIKITAEDDDGIDYVEYYWNDDDSTKKYSDEFTVKVPSEEGKNYLYVRAEDEKGNRTSYERFTYYVEEDYYPGNADNLGELNDAVKELRVEIGNMDDRIVYEPGEEIEYYIDYYNGTSSKITNVKIVVEVPNSDFKMVKVENNGSKTTKKATWNIGTLNSKEAGRVYFTMEYNGKLDNDLVFNIEAKIYKSSKEQDSSFTRNMIYNEDSTKQGNHFAYCSGYPDGRFKPDGTITRAEMATMIARMVGINVDNYAYKNTFTDVSADFWAAGAIQACVDNGLVGAYSYGRFEPELPATRGMISYAIAKVLGVEDVEPIYIRAKDTEKSSAMIPVEQMLRLNIIDGYSDGTAKPDKYITRSEAVVIINKYLFRGELLNNGNNLGYYGTQANGFKQFTDLYYGHWAYNHIMEATHDHNYVRTYDGNETFMY